MSDTNPAVAEEEAELAVNGYRLPSEIVTEFYKVFGEPIPEAGPASLDPSVIPEDRLQLKMKLIAEEFIELVEAVYGEAAGAVLTEAWAAAEALDDGTRDVVGAADALGDLKVVEGGFAIETRISVDAVLAEVHLSNLSKLDENGRPLRSDGTDGKPKNKIIKGVNYFEPDLKAIMAGEVPDRTPKAIKDANR